MPSPNRRPRTKERIKEKDLQGYKYLDHFEPLLERLHRVGTSRDKAGNRELFFDQYLTLLLFAFFNPIITSLRGIQQASELDKVQKSLGVKRMSLGALSEAGNVFDPAALREIVQELAAKAYLLEHKLSPKERELLRGLTAVDGTLLRALPRMIWALWNGDRHAAKMHLQFDVLKGIPCDATFTHGSGAETQQLQENLQSKRLYLLDRGYLSFSLYRAIIDAGSSVIARVKDNTAFTVEEEKHVHPQAREVGVVRDIVVGKLGTPHHKDYLQQPIRLVMVETPEADGSVSTLWLVTDRFDLAPELVAQAYQYRWTVELFFRWFKCILGCRHFMNESPKGVELQCYAALIASLLITLWTGLQPSKRTWEMIQFYLSGWASVEEVEKHLIGRLTTPAKSKT